MGEISALLQVEGLDGVHVLLVPLAHHVEAELHLLHIGEI